MIVLEVQAPFANFRKSFARSYAETYPLPPPATAYGMILSLVGERQRRSHLGVRMALGVTRRPKLTTVLKKMSRYKYGVPSKQSRLGNAPDYMEVLGGIDCRIAIDSSDDTGRPTLEERTRIALENPEQVDRTGVLCLGLSDDLVDVVKFASDDAEPIEWLTADPDGSLELPVWVDHVGSADTRWRRFRLEGSTVSSMPPEAWIQILGPEER